MSIDYTKHGDYYLPNLVYETDEADYGKYGMMRKQFLKEHLTIRYNLLVLSGKLIQELNRVDKQAREMFETIMAGLAKKDPPPPQGTMEWVQHQNRHRAIADEQIMHDLIHSQ